LAIETIELPQEGDLLDGEKVLVTGVTGKIALPIARALAGRNEVWGAARLRNPQDIDDLIAVGITPVPLDMSTGDFSALPSDFTYVFHAAVDPGADDWTRCLKTNAHNSGELLYHCRSAKGFVLCSTGSVYGYPGRRPLTEADGPGVPLRANYSFSKIAAESVCNSAAPRRAEQLQPDLRGRLRRPRHPRHGGRRLAADRGELGW
jgi:UDP-glucuronate 4-epimerase